MFSVTWHEVFLACSLVRHCSINMPWLEWCPDPQRPDAQWIKIFHPGAWTLQEEHDDPPPRHTYREWKEFYDQRSTVPTWYKRDWTTEGYRRAAAPEPDNYFASTFSPDQHSVATQSSTLRMSPQMLEAILRSSDASAFSMRISLVCRQGSASNLRIARVKHRGRINQCVLLETLILLNLLESLILICPQAAQQL